MRYLISLGALGETVLMMVAEIGTPTATHESLEQAVDQFCPADDPERGSVIVNRLGDERVAWVGR